MGLGLLQYRMLYNDYGVLPPFSNGSYCNVIYRGPPLLILKTGESLFLIVTVIIKGLKIKQNQCEVLRQEVSWDILCRFHWCRAHTKQNNTLYASFAKVFDSCCYFMVVILLNYMHVTPINLNGQFFLFYHCYYHFAVQTIPCAISSKLLFSSLFKNHSQT